jgi:hypothetical protein
MVAFVGPFSAGKTLDRIAGSLARGVRLNTVTWEGPPGREVILKRRNGFGRSIGPLANFFFRRTHAPVTLADDEEWRRRELEVFPVLNAPYRAWSVDGRTICEEKLPGESLWSHLQRGTLTMRMMAAAGAELRRAHGLRIGGRAWSHGDAAMGNILYDEEGGRAYLIDFELVHDAGLSEEARHAEDLCAVLFDLVSAVAEAEWMPDALAFLGAYGDWRVMAEVAKRLAVPRGVDLLWWKVRTNFVPARRVEERLGRVREVAEQWALGKGEALGAGGTAPLAVGGGNCGWRREASA